MTTEAIEVLEIANPRVLALVATIPARQRFCESLLKELEKQSRKPDGVILVLDGYGELPAPTCELPVVATYRTPEPSGPGARWLVATSPNIAPDDIIVCIDDDTMLQEAPGFIKALVVAIESGNGAAAAMGKGVDYKAAPPGKFSRGDLIHGAGCGLTVRAKHLVGLQEFAAEIQTAGGPDALGLLGDDDALVSAHLWKTGVRVVHAKTGNIYAAPGSRSTSQTAARLGQHQNLDAQKHAIQKLTGWPCFKVLPPPTVGARPAVRS